MPWILKLSGMVLTTAGYMAGQILLAETSPILGYLLCIPGIILIHLGFSRARAAKQHAASASMVSYAEPEQPSGRPDTQEHGDGDQGKRRTP